MARQINDDAKMIEAPVKSWFNSGLTALIIASRQDRNITIITISSGCFFWAILFSLK